MYQKLSTYNLWYHEPKVKQPSTIDTTFQPAVLLGSHILDSIVMRFVVLVIFSKRVQKTSKTDPVVVPMPASATARQSAMDTRNDDTNRQ